MKVKAKQTVVAGRSSGLVKGAAILGLAAVISKAIGTLQKIPLQNLAGDGVFGVYNVVYPFYTLILVIATAGFPVAVSTFVSEKISRNEYSEARAIVKMAAVILTITGFVFFLLMFFGAKLIADLIGVPDAALAFQSVSLAILIVPVMSVLRGYFQGLGNMLPTAVSQIMEQGSRVMTMIWLLLYFSRAGFNDSWIAAGATFGSVTGAVAGLVVMLFFWKGQNQDYRLCHKAEKSKIRPLIKPFIAYSLPICLGAIVMPMITIVDTLSMPRLLQAGGDGAKMAMVRFGVYHRGIPLVQLVTMVATSMTVVLVPAIAKAKMLGQTGLIRTHTRTVLRFTWLIALAASFGLAVIATPLNVMLYKSTDGSFTMSIIAFTAVFSTMNAAAASILQGLGAIASPARNMFIAAAIKLGGNILFIPLWGIAGAAIAAVIAFAAACLLNLWQIRALTGEGISLGLILLKPLLAIAAMCAAILLYMYAAQLVLDKVMLSSRQYHMIVAIGSVVAGFIVYAGSLFYLRVIKKEDLHYVWNK